MFQLFMSLPGVTVATMASIMQLSHHLYRWLWCNGKQNKYLSTL